MADANEQFGAALRRMDRHDLNRLTIHAYTRVQRRMIDEERVRRRRAVEEEVAEEAAGAISFTTAALLDLINTMAILRMNRGRDGNSTTNQIEGNFSGNNSGENQFSEPAAPVTPNAQPPVKKKKPCKKNKKAIKKSYLFPEYHHLVAEEVEDIVFKSSTADGTRYDETNLVGSLRCSSCGNRWTTGIVATAIRGYEQQNGQLGYSAEVFNQRCAKCDSLGHLTLDVDTYVERVARRLLIWKGEFSPKRQIDRKFTPPQHRTDLCEGCAVDRCPKGRPARSAFDSHFGLYN
ncbi:hypothetical protein TWF106_006276 [Orbilia oligospora]|uniref:3CxxC-type domain-containing protein n=1 Tax=Orbilia oligospora TaxID=2813651 RepID=A0A7C8KSV0_ORBOL|nr:hypothetical protein TWF788_008912 [Orbilia oligospora]KAF3228756.1 hypothetical protein TWF106_006276 [Orbilia oligospora]